MIATNFRLSEPPFGAGEPGCTKLSRFQGLGRAKATTWSLSSAAPTMPPPVAVSTTDWRPSDPKMGRGRGLGRSGQPDRPERLAGHGSKGAETPVGGGTDKGQATFRSLTFFGRDLGIGGMALARLGVAQTGQPSTTPPLGPRRLASSQAAMAHSASAGHHRPRFPVSAPCPILLFARRLFWPPAPPCILYTVYWWPPWRRAKAPMFC